MKKLGKLLLVAALVLVCLLLLPTEAKAATVDDLTFTLNDDGNSYSVTDCSTSASGELTIPATYSGKPVTTIDSFAFSNCTSLASITIPDSATTIDEYAFLDCTGLASVSIGNSVTIIGEGAFKYCTSLTSVTIGSSVTTIGNFAFSNCTSLASITIPDSVTTIDEYAFLDCTGLNRITIPDSVTTIGTSAFYNCTGLASVSIGNSVTIIGEGAFYNCTGLTGVTIGNNVTTIGSSAFYNCTGLTSVTIPDSVTVIGGSAFHNCTGLTGVTISNNVTTIDRQTFCNCTSLASVTIPDSVTTIDQSAFYNCTGLTSVTIGNGITFINSAFRYCTSLTSVTIGNSVTIIGEGAFYKCTSLTGITIPGSVTTIGNSAFENCTSLTSVTIPDSVTTIDDDAFYNCTSLTSITIPSSVTTIGDYAFKDCTGLTTVTICSSCPYIGYAAFGGCTKIADVWYCGDANDRASLQIEEGNAYLENAIWHYGYCVSGHSYDDCYDMDCNTCGYNRTEIHSYSNNCDTSCNVCGELREITHSYTNDCDTSCNVCAYTRTIQHTYDSENDLTCNVCKYSRAPATPIVLENEPDRIVLEGQNGLEYSIDGKAWQNSTTFSGLSHLTTYTFYQRVAQSSTASAGEISPGLTVTTIDKYTATVPLDFTYVEITDTSVELTKIEGCEYSIDGSNWQTSPRFNYLTPGTRYTFYQRTPETSTHYASESAILDITTYSKLGTITYNANGGSNAPGTTTGTISTQKPTRSGYRFIGWALTPDAYAVYQPGDSYCQQEDIVLYAAWASLCDECNGRVKWTTNCSRCFGSGNALFICDSCNGAGKEGSSLCNRCGGYGLLVYSCLECGGHGKHERECSKCTNGIQKFTPEAPQMPKLLSASCNTVVLQDYSTCEYSIDGKNWQDSPIFTGLETGETYRFYQRYVATDITYPSATSTALTVKVKSVQLPPVAPTLHSKTYDTVVLNEVPGCEYSKDGINWQGSNVFTGLCAETNYTFYQRIAESETYYASSQSEGLLVRTDEEPIYTVVFKNWDGAVLSSNTYHYGDAVAVPADPTKAADNTYTYAFAGWDKEVVDCAGDATYTAVYTPTYIDYTVVFKDWDGAVLSSTTYHWGDAVTAPTDLTKAADNTYTYTFAGWDKTVVNCAGDATYTATYTPTYIEYIIVFAKGDTPISIKTYHWGDVVTAPEDPTKAADDTYIYTFAGWDKEIVNCAGGADYTAVFTATHYHTHIESELVEPTCTEQGYTIYACACGDTYKDDYTESIGHTYANACDTACDVCGATRTVGAHQYTDNSDTTCDHCGAYAYPGGNTLVKENGIWYHVVDRQKVSDTTLVYYGGYWFYIKDGVINYSNTLCKWNGMWFHVKDGKVVYDTTLVSYGGIWFYVKDGQVNYSNTLCNWNGKWWHVKDGKVVYDTTLVYFASKWYYVKSGVLNYSNTLCNWNGKWWHVKDGNVVYDTTLVYFANKWYYVKSGVLNYSNTLCNWNGKWYHVKNGTVVYDTTLVYFGSNWYCVRNGVVDFNYSGKVLFAGTYYTVKNGVKV